MRIAGRPEPNITASAVDMPISISRKPNRKVKLLQWNSPWRWAGALSDLEGLGPLVREEDVAALGRRDQADTQAYGNQRIGESLILVLDLAALRMGGIRSDIDLALRRLGRTKEGGFWVHLDVDVLHDDVMPAVDYLL